MPTRRAVLTALQLGRAVPTATRAGGRRALVAFAIFASLYTGSANSFGDLGTPPLAAAEPSPCVPLTSRIAYPPRIALGSTTFVTATIAIDCPDAPMPLDIVLVVDRSPSMKGIPLDDARAAAAAFVARADLLRSRIALVSFSDEGDVNAELSHDERYLLSAISRIRTPTRGGTDVAAGLRAAGRVLSGERSRTEASGVIVLLSDARNGLGELPVVQQARILRESGIHIVTIALGIAANTELMAAIASSPEDAHASADSSELTAIFERIATGLLTIGARDVAVNDVLGEGIDYLPGSSRPPARFDGLTVEWSLGLLGSEPRSLALELRPDRLGRLPTSAGAQITWTDSLGLKGRGDIPIPEIEVFDPSVEPTSVQTNTPTSSPTAPSPPIPPIASATPTSILPALHFAYLPWTSRSACRLSHPQVDIVLLIDASTTMERSLSDGRTRLEAARQAALVFAERTMEQGGKVGLATFDSGSRVLVAPTRDRSLIEAGLDSIATAVGSRLDLGLISAHATLDLEPAPPAPPPPLLSHALSTAIEESKERARLIVVLTDGRVVGATEGEVESAANAARGSGIELWSIALGADTSGLALLERITLDPARVLGGAGETDLDTAFAEIFAGAVCK